MRGQDGQLRQISFEAGRTTLIGCGDRQTLSMEGPRFTSVGVTLGPDTARMGPIYVQNGTLGWERLNAWFDETPRGQLVRGALEDDGWQSLRFTVEGRAGRAWTPAGAEVPDVTVTVDGRFKRLMRYGATPDRAFGGAVPCPEDL